MDFENYPIPPIQEAVLDIFTTVPPDVDLEALSAFGKMLGREFPDRKPRFRFSSSIKVDFEDSSKSSAAGTSTHVGWIYRTAERERAVQARLDGFTFNRLPVYDGWARFSAEARAHWATYQKIATPQFVSTIGLRYINRILIPMPFQDFRDYCLLFPAFPKGIPTQLNEFMMRFVVPSVHAAAATSTITVTFEPPPSDRAVLPLILDVHVTQPFRSLPATDDDQIWSAFELLRTEKNVLFESSITDSARKLFRK